MSTRSPRVLIILGAIPLYGLELSIIDVGVMLRAAGAEVRFVVNRHWGHVAIVPRLEALGFEHEGVVFFGSVERGIGLRRLLVLLRLQITENLRLASILRRYDPTHVHLGTHWDFLNLMPALLLWRGTLVFQAGDPPSVRHPLLDRLWRAVMRRASVLVPVSRDLASRFAALGLAARRVEVIGHRVPARPPSDPAAVPTRTARCVFICVGQISAHKGSDLVLTALRELLRRGHDVACWMLGAADDAWTSALRAANDDLVASARVCFAGYVNDPTPWLAAADVHVMPSRVPETFGIAVAEAKAAGRPSIVARIGALPELVRDGVDGRLVPSDDAAALTDAMAGYAQQPALAQQHGSNARHSFAELGLDRVAERWATVYGMRP